MGPNRINPPGSQFIAIVDGKPTGLAGCPRSAECARGDTCLRSSPRLTTKMDPKHCNPGLACQYHIHTTA